MSLTKRVGLLSGVAVLALSGGSFADPAADATNQELRSRISELENRLAAVEANGDQNWLTDQRAAEVRNLVHDVLADADMRSSMLAQGMTAGYDDGAVIASADGSWLLRTNMHMQQRFVINTQDNAPGGAAAADSLWGFENSRTKFILSGNVVSPEWFYKVEIEVGSTNMGLIDDRTGLGDAYIGYDYGNGWKVIVGTYKTPLLREELVDSRYQLLVERSLTNDFFTGGRTDGLMVDYMGDQFHVMGSWNDGVNVGGVPATTQDTEVAFTVRGEWLAMGNWDQFMDFTSPSGEETGVLVGGALHYQTADDGLLDVDLLILTIDGQVEFGGGNLFASFVYSDIDAAGLADVSPWGIIVQGGYYFTDSWEGFGRYELTDFDVAGAELSIITFGVNKYFAGHNAKWTTDIGFALDTVPLGSTIHGYRADAPGEDGQVVIRSQLQIVF